MNIQNEEVLFNISIKQVKMLSSKIYNSNEFRFSFISLCYYTSISDGIFHLISKIYLWKIAKRVLIQWIFECDKSNMSLGISGGYIGYSYLCYSLLNKEKWYRKIKLKMDEQYTKKAFQLLLQYKYNKDHRFLDVLNGTLCIVNYLLKTGYKDQKFFERIYNYFLNKSSRLLADKGKIIDIGMAHGTLGILIILFECEKILKYQHKLSVQIAEKYYELLCEDSIVFPQLLISGKNYKVYQKCKRYGWCYGSLETLNVLHYIFKSTNHYLGNVVEELILKYSSFNVNDLGLHSSIFCHGYSSAYLINYHFYKNLNIPISQEFIRLLRKRIMDFCDLSKEYCFRLSDQIYNDDFKNISIIDGNISPTISLLSSSKVKGYDFFSQALFINLGENYV